MVSMPYCLASRGLPIETGSPLMRIWPESAGRAPDSARISVDFPAPLPPTRPMTSPGYRSTLTLSTAWTPPNAILMLRISTSGRPFADGAGGRVASAASFSTSLMLIASSSRSACAPAQGRIRADRGHEDDADDDVLDRRVDTEQDHARLERLHDHGTEDGARDGPDAACERCPADDRRRDDVQLGLRAESGDAGVQTGGQDGRADRGERAHDHERQHDGPPGRDPAELGSLGVAADREDVSAEASASRQDRHDDGHADGDEDRVCDADRRVRALSELLGEGGRPVVAVGDPDRAEDGRDADDHERRLGPLRTDREAVFAPSPATGDEAVDDPDAGEDADRPAERLAERTGRSATEKLEVRVEWRDRLPGRFLEGETRPDQKAAKGDDEGWHAEVGDDEALEGTDCRAEGEPDREHDDPGIRLAEQTRRQPLGLEHGHRHAGEGQDRSDRQVDVARHDDEDHPGRHDPDRGALDRQVPEVPRRQEQAAGHDIEADPDDDERADQTQQPRIDLEGAVERSGRSTRFIRDGLRDDGCLSHRYASLRNQPIGKRPASRRTAAQGA